MNDDHLRISDEERERAASELGEHYASGRLDHAEHSDRLDRVWAARTRGELPAIFRDLPGTGYGRGPAFPPFGTFPQRPGTPTTWVGGPVVRRQRGGMIGPFVAVLGVLVVITVVTHAPVFILALLAWFLVSRAGRGSRSRSRRGGPGDGYGGANPPWGRPGR